MAGYLFPILVTPAGVFRRVYVDPKSLRVIPFERELAGAVAFNGIGVIGPSSARLPRSVKSDKVREEILIIKEAVAHGEPETLHFIPFG